MNVSNDLRCTHCNARLSVNNVCKNCGKSWKGSHPRSRCCDAYVKLEGRTTKWYVCVACQKPCDINWM